MIVGEDMGHDSAVEHPRLAVLETLAANLLRVWLRSSSHIIRRYIGLSVDAQHPSRLTLTVRTTSRGVVLKRR